MVFLSVFLLFEFKALGVVKYRIMSNLESDRKKDMNVAEQQAFILPS